MHLLDLCGEICRCRSGAGNRMKKIKGSALLWCLAILIVLSIITLTAVSLSVAYYKSCVRSAGDSQAEINSQAAAETLRSQLESSFGRKRIYFTYSGSSLLDSFSPDRQLDITESDREYFKLNEGSEEEKYLTAIRKLENELFVDYIKNKNGKRTPVRITFNYGRIDTSVYNHGYYGDTADIIIDSIEETDADEDGYPDYYTVTVKAESVLSTGHRAAAGAVFRIKPSYFNAERIPAVSCALMEIGLTDDPEFDLDLDYTNSRGVILGLSDEDQCVLICGDNSDLEMENLGFIKTDADYSNENMILDEVSYIDNNSFRIVSDNYAVLNYVGFHPVEDNNSMDFSDDYISYRCTLAESQADLKSMLKSEHAFDETNITNDESILDLDVVYALPDAFTKGDNTNNRAKRYFVSGENDSYSSEICTFDEKGEKEYYLSFSSYVNYHQNNSAPYGDNDFSDKYNKYDDLICCTVKKCAFDEEGNPMGFDPSVTAELNNIVLEDDKTYFFRICQDTKISFSPQCSGVNANVYFQLYDGGENYPIELTIENPPEGINFFSFDSSADEISSIRPSSSASNQKNVTIALTDDTDEYYIHGWFSCYKFSVLDKNQSDTVSIPKRVYLCAAKPSEFITIFNFDETVAVDQSKSYTWAFEKFVPADSGISQ